MPPGVESAGPEAVSSRLDVGIGRFARGVSDTCRFGVLRGAGREGEHKGAGAGDGDGSRFRCLLLARAVAYRRCTLSPFGDGIS